MSSPTPPTIIVHNRAHCVAALRAAAHCGIFVRLASARDAVRYQGVGWLLACARSAATEAPSARWTLVLDCGDAPGLALAAAEAGVPSVALHDLAPETVRRAQDILSATRTTLEIAVPAGLDLLSATDPEQACRTFLFGDSATSH